MPLAISNTFAIRIFIVNPMYGTSAVLYRTVTAMPSTLFVAMNFANSHHSALALKASSPFSSPAAAFSGQPTSTASTTSTISTSSTVILKTPSSAPETNYYQHKNVTVMHCNVEGILGSDRFITDASGTHCKIRFNS